MTHRAHLLLTPAATGNFSALLQSLGRRGARYINDRYRRTGALKKQDARDPFVVSRSAAIYRSELARDPGAEAERRPRSPASRLLPRARAEEFRFLREHLARNAGLSGSQESELSRLACRLTKPGCL